MKRLTAFVLLVLTVVVIMLAGCSSSASTSDRSWEKVKQKGEFVMGLDEKFPPMGFRNEKNELIGFDIDLATEVCSRLGIKLKLQPINWDAKEQELNTGNIDCIWNGFTMTEERKNKILFTKPYMNNRQVLIVMSDSVLSEFSDFAGKKLGLQAASSAVDALDKSEEFKSKLGKVIEFDENMIALMDMEKGGVDAVLMDEIVARYYIQMKNKGYRVLDQELATEEYGIGFRKNDSSLMQMFQETLEAMAKDGKVAEISDKWFGKDITTISQW